MNSDQHLKKKKRGRTSHRHLFLKTFFFSFAKHRKRWFCLLKNRHFSNDSFDHKKHDSSGGWKGGRKMHIGREGERRGFFFRGEDQKKKHFSNKRSYCTACVSGGRPQVARTRLCLHDGEVRCGCSCGFTVVLQKVSNGETPSKNHKVKSFTSPLCTIFPQKLLLILRRTGENLEDVSLLRQTKIHRWSEV